jgi:hypothetical protein
MIIDFYFYLFALKFPNIPLVSVKILAGGVHCLMEPWKELIEYWQSKHVEGRPPGRRDIDPAIDIPRLAANLLIADVVPEGYRYRLVGSAIVERHREDMTGRLAGSSRFLQRVRENLIAIYDAVRISRQPRMMVSGRTSTGKPEAVTIVLPLVGGDGATNMLLIGVFYERRFEQINDIDYLTTKTMIQ